MGSSAEGKDDRIPVNLVHFWCTSLESSVLHITADAMSADAGLSGASASKIRGVQSCHSAAGGELLASWHGLAQGVMGVHNQ